MSTFEERIRTLAGDNPRLSIASAVTIADHGDNPPPFPGNPSNWEAGAVWALAIPSILDLLHRRDHIGAIKEIRDTAPPPENRLTISLKDAKEIADRARSLL